MELESLSKESLVALIMKLVESEAVSLQDLEEVVVQSPTPEMMQMTDMLHSMLCTDDHDLSCMYYKEEEQESTWVRPAHARWLRVMSRVSATYHVNFMHIATVNRIISDAASSLINTFKDRRQLNLCYQLARQVFTDMIDENLPMLQDITADHLSVQAQSCAETSVVCLVKPDQLD